jgi:SAM-dependent methyltransferase
VTSPIDRRDRAARVIKPDAKFADPRLALLYDAFEGERRDLDAYVAMVDEFDARTVLDVGCGTGTFACMLATRGVDVVGVDPAAASLDVARAKPGADEVRWILGDAAALPPLQVDLATMTGNVAQVFLTDDEWLATLRAIRAALRPGGRLVFETRDPERQQWLEWDRQHTDTEIEVPTIGLVTTWCELLDVTAPLVTFRGTYEFAADGSVLTSDSTLRFRSRDEVEQSLTVAGYVVDEMRDAPDRPGKEFVFVASAD